MGFLDDLFGKGTEKKVTQAVDDAVVKGKEFSEMAVETGKVAAKVMKEKGKEAKATIQIEKLKYSIGDAVVKSGLPITKNDAKIKPMLDKIEELKKVIKAANSDEIIKKAYKAKTTAKKAKKTTKKSKKK